MGFLFADAIVEEAERHDDGQSKKTKEHSIHRQLFDLNASLSPCGCRADGGEELGPRVQVS
jgi:hypothetical protein